MNLDTAQMNQVYNHLGHTYDVHRDFYRQYDSIAERLDIAKLLILQDQNMVSEYIKDQRIDYSRLTTTEFNGNAKFFSNQF